MTADFDPKTIRKSLDALRAKHGADTPIGHRCSNLIEMLSNLHAAKDADQRRFLTRCIESCMAELSKLSSVDTPHAEERG